MGRNRDTAVSSSTDKMRVLSIITVILVTCQLAQGQYAPQAGMPGSTAIPGSSGQIVAWATACNLQRGYLDISQPSLGVVSSGDSSLAIGPADNFVVSLGDSGVAVLQFGAPITNGTGPDFLVFENGFLNPADAAEAFLEFAFVEVSSDGLSYYRFPVSCLLPTDPQIPGAGVYVRAEKVHNLAGKYVGGYGVPFDLQDLAGSPGLDLDHITHVRIVDVVGAVSGHSSTDDSGRVINDPYPTDFPTGGFDLDAVGVLHQQSTNVADVSYSQPFIYPNPAQMVLHLHCTGEFRYHISDLSGRLVLQGHGDTTSVIGIGGLPAGTYLISIRDRNGNPWTERLVKY